MRPGETFGRLTVVSELTERTKQGKVRVACECSCGNKVEVVASDLRSGMTKSCGCLQREVVSKLNLKHGMGSTRNNPHPVYRVWVGMRNRCNNPKDKHFADYGGRGIFVSPEWDDFEVFLRDMGDRPSPKHSIDRIDNNLGYFPGNCRWATPDEQATNRRPHANQRVVVVDGVEYPSLRKAAAALHICRNTLSKQLDNFVKS